MESAAIHSSGVHEVDSKTYPSFLTLKEGSTFLTKPLFPQGREDVTALLGAQNRYALRLADQSGLRHVVRDGTAWMQVGTSSTFWILEVFLRNLEYLDI